MAYVALLHPQDLITDLTGYRLFATLLAGTNGSCPWAPELFAGTQPEDAAYATAVWDGNLEDGFNSEPVAVQFDADLTAGTATLDTSNDCDSPATFSGASGGSIGSVVIVAGAQVEGSVAWKNLTITFWDGNGRAETVSVGGGPVADTTDTGGGVEEQSLVVTPAAQHYDRVSVQGTLKMQARPDLLPGFDDLFGHILISQAA